MSNLAGEYSTSEITSRGNARPDAAAVADIVGKDLVPIGGLGQRWGDPDVEALKFSVNSGLDLSDSLELYGFATYMDNTTKSDFFYRGPVLADPAQQVALSARPTLQVDNVNNATLVAGADGLPDPAPQSFIDGLLGQGLDPNDYLVPDGSSASGYSLRNPIYSEFPGGYNPNFGAKLTDLSIVLGAAWGLDRYLDLGRERTVRRERGRIHPF